MQYSSLMLVILGCLAVYVSADQSTQQQLQLQPITESLGESDGATHVRAKRTLFLKKKLLGAGLLGFGLGAAKGFKLGYHTSPEVHHVYLSAPPPPVRYVEYIEKPVYVSKPVYHDHHHESAWSQPEPSPVYGSW